MPVAYPDGAAPAPAIVDELYVLLFLNCGSPGCQGFFEPSKPFEPLSMDEWSFSMAQEAELEGWKALADKKIICPACHSASP